MLLAIAGWWVLSTPITHAQLSSEDRSALVRAESVFGTEEETGQLVLEASYLFADVTARGQRGQLTVVAEGLGEGGSSADALELRLSLVLEDRDGTTWIRHHRLRAPAGIPAWSFESELELPAEIRDLVVVVEETGTGSWGAVVAQGEEVVEPPPGAVAAMKPGIWSVFETAGSARAEVGSGEPGPGARVGVDTPASAQGAQEAQAAQLSQEERAGRGRVIRLLPPRSGFGRGRALAGATRIETLVSDFEVSRVSFLLEGQEVASDDKEPFEARLDLAGPGTPQRLEVRAFNGQGQLVGSDALTLNEAARAFRVRLSKVEGSPRQGALDVEAEVDLPARQVLDRVELYFNQELAARFDSPPYRARLETPGATGQDFVRAVAYLADGTSVEDVALLGVEGVSEQLNVTLVELYTVVTDRDGRPVGDLGKEDFSLRHGNQRPRIESLSYATDIPLTLGLVIDTSASMEHILTQTKQAAAQFLNQVLSGQDRAFLVDFSTRPRLRHRATGNLMELIAAFRGMRADGATALYDSILFSLVELTDGPGRRALVMLTDGDDYRSNFGPNRAIRDARRLGVPLYVIAFSGGPRERGISGTGRLELEAVTEQTGGRLFLIREVDELGAAYAQIEEELRSQYLITFYAEGGPESVDPGRVEVEVAGRGREARVVVGAQ